MSQIYDTLIIGAGPAGSACTKKLIDSGLNVKCLDFRNRPRYKACGGLISKRCQGLIKEIFSQDIPNDIICQVPQVQTYQTKDGRMLETLFDDKHLSVDRRDYDYWLNSFIESHIQKALYISHTFREDKLIEVIISINGKRDKLLTKYLVAADGGNSSVRKHINPRFKNKVKYLYMQNIYKGTGDFDPDGYYYLMGRYFSDLFAIFCCKNDELYVGTTFIQGKNSAAYFQKVEECITNLFNIKLEKKIRAEACAFSLSPFVRKFNPGKDNTILIGESAGLISSFGEGIPSALYSGAKAAESIIYAENKKSDVLELYNSKVQSEVELLREEKIRYGV